MPDKMKLDLLCKQLAEQLQNTEAVQRYELLKKLERKQSKSLKDYGWRRPA